MRRELEELGYRDADDGADGVSEERIARLAEGRADGVVFEDSGGALHANRQLFNLPNHNRIKLHHHLHVVSAKRESRKERGAYE